jgi:Zn-dependent metalloprotease
MPGHYPICGFVPPYILEAVAKSNDAVKESRDACEHTLRHGMANAQHRHEECVKARVSIRSHDLWRQPKSNRESLQARFSSQRMVRFQIAPKRFTNSPQKQIMEQNAQQPLSGEQQAPDGPVKRQIYDCKGTARLPGTLVRSEGDVRTKDRQVNNTYDGFGIVRNFFQEVFGRRSLDNKGLLLKASVHYNEANSPAGYNNAYWDGNSKQMVFGDGDHIAFDYLTDSLDVIGHELSHGFVQFSSPLEYKNQSGALNESCADIFGSMAEQWHTHQTADEADWNLGQTLFPVAFTGSCLRTLKAGKAYANDPVFGTDPQPKHMKDMYTGDEDGGGVHINSGIPNHACEYLISDVHCVYGMY